MAGNRAKHQSRSLLLNQMEGGGDIRSKCRAISRSHPCSRKSFSACRNASSWVEWGMLMVLPSMVQTKMNFSAILPRLLDGVALLHPLGHRGLRLTRHGEDQPHVP